VSISLDFSEGVTLKIFLTKTLKISITIITFIFIHNSCSLIEDDILEKKSSVLSIYSISTNSRNVSIIAKASWHNGCGRF